jgi:hypothetical protein
MDAIEAKILLKNLLNRIKITGDGSKQLDGVITPDEFDALTLALEMLNGRPTDPAVAPQSTCADTPLSHGTHEAVLTSGEGLADKSVVSPAQTVSAAPVVAPTLNLSVFDLPAVDDSERVCLDFGTAMSKASLVKDSVADFEEITVLSLGIPGDQEELSQAMLISSVYIDNAGLLWFGRRAVDRSLIESEDGARQRLDNIKRRLSEGGLQDTVSAAFNPTDCGITYGDVVLAYLVFLTWAMNQCLDQLLVPRNVTRRFAMPCFPGQKARETAHRLRDLLGEAQVLSDTFEDRLNDGLPLSEFVASVAELRKKAFEYPFVGEDITEPLGVAGSLISWKSRVDMLAMVVDVGAGTSDLSLYRVVVDPSRQVNDSREVEGAALGITEAGNHLDKLLIACILRKANIPLSHPDGVTIQRKLELSIRDLKETLFNEESVLIALPELDELTISLSEFQELAAVAQFGASLKQTMQEILERIDESWIDWVLADSSRYLTIVLTGGGAGLPMVRELAEGSISVRGKQIRLVPARSFPSWLQDDYPDLEPEYARIAVSLGGARKKLIARGGAASITGGGIRATPRLGGFYTKGV